MGTVTIILQDAPYGSERIWNALRLSQALMSTGSKVRIFLYGDSVLAAKKGHEPPAGHYNISQMLSELMGKGAEVVSCMTCTKARGLKQGDFIDGAKVGKTLDLARWVTEIGQVLVF